MLQKGRCGEGEVCPQSQRATKWDSHYHRIRKSGPGLFSLLESVGNCDLPGYYADSSICRKLGVIIRLFDNCKLLRFTILTSFVKKYLTLLRNLPLAPGATGPCVSFQIRNRPHGNTFCCNWRWHVSNRASALYFKWLSWDRLPVCCSASWSVVLSAWKSN